MGHSKGKKNKYKTVIKDVFSDDYKSDEIQKHNVKKLLFYASTNPDKLQEMGQYLVEKLHRRMKKDFEGHIVTTMTVFDELIGACPEHLPLFGGSVVAACKVLLTNRPQSSHCAINTWKTYMQCERDLTQLDWHFFVQHFAKMIAPSSSPDVRRDGLEGLAAFISATEDFDALIAKYVATATDKPEEKSHNLLWAALNSSEELSEGVKMVLTSLSRRMNSMALRVILEIVAKYVTTKTLWTLDEELVHRYLISLAGTSSMHRRQIIIFLAEFSESQEGNVQNAVVAAMVRVAEQGVSAPVLDAVAPLVRHGEDRSKALVVLLRAVTDAERMEAIEIILRHEESNKNRAMVKAVSEHFQLGEKVELYANTLNRLRQFAESAREAPNEEEQENLFPEDVPAISSKSDMSAAVDELEKAAARGDRTNSPTKRRGTLPVFDADYKNVKEMLEEEVARNKEAEETILQELNAVIQKDGKS